MMTVPGLPHHHAATIASPPPSAAGALPGAPAALEPEVPADGDVPAWSTDGGADKPRGFWGSLFKKRK